MRSQKSKASSPIDQWCLQTIKLTYAQNAQSKGTLDYRRGDEPHHQEDDTIQITNSRKLVDTRNRIIHGYDSVSDDVI
jgi:hypothetical protein